MTLTTNEYEILEVLWTADRALTRSEILKLSVNKSWKDRSIHILLNNLLAKEAIIVEGYASSGTNYGRTYRAALSREEYALEQLESTVAELQPRSIRLSKIFSALIDSCVDADTLSELEQMIEAKKKSLADEKDEK